MTAHAEHRHHHPHPRQPDLEDQPFDHYQLMAEAVGELRERREHIGLEIRRIRGTVIRPGAGVNAYLESRGSTPLQQGAHLLRHETPAIAQTTEQKIRGGDQTADWVLVAIGYDAAALDFAGVRLRDGRRITVTRDWNGDTPEARFLKRIRDDACRIFGTVLSPDYNAVHRDHLHLEATDTRFCR